MVTIEQFQAIYKITQEHTSPTSEILTVAILHRMTERQVRDLSIDAYRELKNAIVIDPDPPQTTIASFEIDGITYNVDTIFKYAGQFMDFSEAQKDSIAKLHIILAIFAMPEGEYYTDNFDKRAEIFRTKCDYRVAQSVAFFFSRLIRELSQNAKIYSQVQAAVGMKKNGGGLQRLIHWLTETALNGTSFSKWAARNFLAIYRK